MKAKTNVKAGYGSVVDNETNDPTTVIGFW
jgi:hypothetical protein